MSDAQLDEFESFIDRNDEAGALHWLETNFPEYKKVVAEELDKLKGEIKTQAPAIVEATHAEMQANAGGQQPGAQQAQQSQPYQQQQSQNPQQQYPQQPPQYPPQQYPSQPSQPPYSQPNHHPGQDSHNQPLSQ
jgi:hypothetical protein